MTVSYIETLVAGVIMASVIVGGVMYAIGIMIMNLIKKKGDIG